MNKKFKDLIAEKGGNKAAIGRKLGVSGQRIGQYITERQKPKDDFFEKWQSVFGENIRNIFKQEHQTNVPREQENEVQDEWPGIKNDRKTEPTERELMAMLLQAINRQNKILDRQQDDTIDRLKLIEANLNRVAGKAEGLQYDLISGRETILRSLSRLENKPEESLLNEADRLRQSLAMANHELSKTGLSGK